jgi:hypothetical protein
VVFGIPLFNIWVSYYSTSKRRGKPPLKIIL